jgi:hypothetical protein
MLQRHNQCPSLQGDNKTMYTSSQAQAEMLDAINATVKASIDADIHHSDIGIILDETTDVTIHKKLNMYFHCLRVESNEPVVHFVDCVSVLDGKADTLIDAIVELCRGLGLDCAKIANMASDGASVMTGRKGGVGVKFKTAYSPRLIHIHCAAHRLALAAGQACKDVPMLNEFQLTLKMVYRYFHNSAVRYNQLRAMESVLEDDSMRRLALKEPASFRWLSLEAAVTAAFDVYPALLQTLEAEAATGKPEAKRLYNKVRPVTFLLTAAFLKDVLSVVCKLSRILQRDHVDIETVNVMVETSLATLTELKTDNGDVLSKMYGDLELREGHYRDVKIQDRQALRMQFQTAAAKYLDQLGENIRNRFDEESMGKLKLLNSVLNPSSVSAAASIPTYGTSELDELCEFLGEGDKPLVDSTRMKSDFKQFKSVLKTMKGKSLRDACVMVINQYSDVFPDFATLAKLMLSAPMTSVACERGFSSQNRVKTKARSSLKHDTVTKLIRIMEDGPTLDNYDPADSARRFLKSKPRK